MGEALELFVGKQVKIVFDDGGQIKVKYGTLVSAAGGFATLKTAYGVCAIQIAEIIKVQTTPPSSRRKNND